MSGNSAPYYKQNRLKQLRAFCATAHCGSISKAAEKLFLSQPSISLQIQALERELDTTLFERRGPNIRLTPEGKTLLEISLPLVQGIDSLTDTFTERSGNLEQGELNIAAGESTILYILPEVIAGFSQKFPGIRIKLHNVTGRDGMELLRSDAADFAIGSMLEIPEDIHYHPIFQFNPVLITPVDHPLSPNSRT
jgi:DNA-binding transcriptional LysR family regulator